MLIGGKALCWQSILGQVLQFTPIGIAAQNYKKDGMAAYSKIQQKEFEAEKHGYTAIKHQREVGASYFDSISQTISSGQSSTTAMSGSTESEQF